jgi:DNA-directed RNA polymerase beta' subunit
MSSDSENSSEEEDVPKIKIDFFSKTTPKPVKKEKVENKKYVRPNVEKILKELKDDDSSVPIKDPPLKEIKSISFGVLGPDEIQGFSTCRLTKSNITSPHRDTVYDERMGPSDIKGDCASCSQSIKVCPGHFGYIELATPVINPQFTKTIVNILNCVCLSCSTIKLSKEELQLEFETEDLTELSGSEIQSLLSLIPQCLNCKEPTPKIIQQDAKIYKTFLNKDQKKKSLIRIDELLTILKKISDEDLILMGYNIYYRNCKKHNTMEEKIPSFRPEYLIITHLPVLPSVSRPPNFEGGMKNNDDLTSSYVEIIKNNQKIYECENEKDREDRINTLESYLCSFIDNTDESTKHTSGKPIKSIKERLAGKDALIRGKIMGKRVDVSARTVITADTELDIDEAGVPYEICEKLTKPEIVTKRNYERLNRLFEEGKVNMIKRKVRDEVRTYMIMRLIKGLQLGDEVFRQLQKGDDIVLNRQPTLHRGGIMGHKCVPLPGKTFRLNLAVTSSYGADFNYSPDLLQN